MDGTMMVVLIVAISMGAWVVVEIWKSFFSWLESRQSSDAGSSLRTSELEAIIEGAVREATRPLEDKIEHLEAILDQPKLTAPLLDELEEEEEEQSARHETRIREE